MTDEYGYGRRSGASGSGSYGGSGRSGARDDDRYQGDRSEGMYGASGYGGGGDSGGRMSGYGGRSGGLQGRRGGAGKGRMAALRNIDTSDIYSMAPLVLGGVMAALGLRRGGWLGYGVALAGLGVMQQTFSGKPAIMEWMGYGAESDHESRAVTVSHTVTINKDAGELYRFWRDFSNLPRFMAHLERVEVIDDRHSHWVAHAPAGLHVSWEAEVTEEQENRRIAWHSREGADVPNWGHVEFRPATGGRGTEVHAVIRYEPPGGAIGRAVAKLFGQEPQQQMRYDLGRFKRMMETGAADRGETGSAGGSGKGTAMGTSAGTGAGSTAGAGIGVTAGASGSSGSGSTTPGSAATIKGAGQSGTGMSGGSGSDSPSGGGARSGST